MNESQYFPNIYRKLIINKAFHLIIMIIEYSLTILIELIIFFSGFSSEYSKTIKAQNFILIVIKGIDGLSITIRLIILIILFIIIPIYYIVYNKIQF
jgi:hypothetical protein